MTALPRQELLDDWRDGGRAHLVLYDGVCGLCNRMIRVLLEHDRRGVFVFASLQSTVGRTTVERFGVDPGRLSSFHLVEDYRAGTARLFSRSGAALFIAGELGWPWKVAGALRLLPAAWLDRAYDLVARNRDRVFGQYETCLTPRPEYGRRLID